jgi:hypothetical protein
LSQMEPTDQLDAPNRGLRESRVERFAKRNSASRPRSIVLANPAASSTSTIEQLGSRWLWRRCFGASQGQSWGQFHCTMSVPDVASAALSHGATNPRDTRRANCRNRQKERLLQEVRGAADRGTAYIGTQAAWHGEDFAAHTAPASATPRDARP